MTLPIQPSLDDYGLSKSIFLANLHCDVRTLVIVDSTNVVSSESIMKVNATMTSPRVLERLRSKFHTI